MNGLPLRRLLAQYFFPKLPREVLKTLGAWKERLQALRIEDHPAVILARRNRLATCPSPVRDVCQVIGAQSWHRQQQYDGFSELAHHGFLGHSGLRLTRNDTPSPGRPATIAMPQGAPL